MAPPGGIPQGYSQSDHIPPKFMEKNPPPEGADTNTRAYLIFFGYLGLCASLTIVIVQRLLKSYRILYKSTTARPPPKEYVWLFACLAAGSLGTTWYHMFQFFNISYQQWYTWRSYYDLPAEKLHWGLWLKETSLFKEAWQTAIVGNARYWWTHQIFLFACGLGLDLERRGVPRGIRHTWAFMLLGQIVAISFATNLFLLALLLSPPALPAPTPTALQKNKWYGPWLINLVAIAVTEIAAFELRSESYWYWHGKSIMPVLIAPHVALLVLPIARGSLPSRYISDNNVAFVDDVYKWLWRMTIAGGAWIWVTCTVVAINYGGVAGILNALFEHSAITSVGFDVVFCWITWFSWWSIRRAGLEELLVTEEENEEVSWKGIGTATTVTSADDSGAVRRR
ncbi:hypothetical protein K491DRAFT_712240 [Lophiostoma macrostomum CBS 122681]|uniref:Uncharacterized protein n=1 Tax=Lophiostoma macrostomum CBS 122681 TaxID=1314788 RepID=A0A6A6TIU6_9PLEO|nr:hypothetical protein K491DRAFT_712240 [Lophiostoma macrostomum CBS 122681]